MRGIFIILLCILILFCSFLSANTIEPALFSKKIILDLIQQGCNLPFLIDKTNGKVIKPVWGSHHGQGVDKESSTWTINICENQTGVPCFSQVYHPGPYEGRITKEGTQWKTVVWKVPWFDTQTEPPAFETTFPWMDSLKQCLESVLPQTSFLAIDFRTNGIDILPLEVNGAYGLTYDFVLEKQHIIVELLHWILLRSIYGFYNLDIWVFRLWDVVQLWYHKWRIRRVRSRVWF